MLPRLAAAKMYVAILFLCGRVCVCGVEISQGMAAQPEGVSGKILEGTRNVRESFSQLTCIHVYMLLCLHTYANLGQSESACVSAGGRHEKHFHSGNAVPALIDRPWHPYAKLTPPHTDSLLPVK